MMRPISKRITCMALILFLAACGQQDRTNNAASLTTAIPSGEDNGAVASEDNGSTDTNPGDDAQGGGDAGSSAGSGSFLPGPRGAAPSTIVSPGTLPIAFRGFWTGLNADCGDARADTRLMIGPKELRFYESVGKVTGVEQAGPLAVIVDADFEGEGQSWSRQQKLTLSADETHLTIANQVVRRRCSGGR